MMIGKERGKKMISPCLPLNSFVIIPYLAILRSILPKLRVNKVVDLIDKKYNS